MKQSIISREVYNSSIVAIYHKWLRNALNNTKARNQVLQPHGLTNSLITSNILCFHSGGSTKSLLCTFSINSFSSCYKHKAISGSFFIILVACNVRVGIADNLIIGQHINVRMHRLPKYIDIT